MKALRHLVLGSVGLFGVGACGSGEQPGRAMLPPAMAGAAGGGVSVAGSSGQGGAAGVAGSNGGETSSVGGAGASGAGAGTGGTPSASAPAKNVLFILVDDLGYSDIGAFNADTFYETPSVDRLASEGMRFTAGYAASPVCSPTRFSIMTGKYPARAGTTQWFSSGQDRSATFLPAQYQNYMAPAETTLAEAFREGGFRTAFVGKWHLGHLPEHMPENQGFEVNVGGGERGSPPSYFSPYGLPNLPDGPPGEHLPVRLVDEALDLVDGFGDERFLLYLSFYSVHTPLQAPEGLIQKYQAKAAVLPAGEDFAPEEQVWPDAGARRVRVRQNHPVYAAMVESMDAQVGRLLDGLAERGLSDDTLVVFMGDNGGVSTAEGSPTSNLPLRGGKGWLYEGGLREPLIIKWPSAKQVGVQSPLPVVSTDFYPTLLEAAGLPLRPEQHQDGVSLVPLFSGARDLPREALFFHYPHYANQGGFPGGAVISGAYKLIQRYEDGRSQLYNLRDDLGEQDDLAQSMPDEAAALRQRLHDWYTDVDAKFLRAKQGGPQPWQGP